MESNLLEELYKLSDCKCVDACEERCINRHVREYGSVDNAINACIDFLPACRTIYDNGVHRCQTTSYIYKKTFAEIKYLFEHYEPTLDLTTIVRKCITEHQLNLTFELDHPPLDLKVKSKKTSKRKVKEEGDLFPDIPKVKQQAKKLSASLHFKFTANGSTSV